MKNTRQWLDYPAYGNWRVRFCDEPYENPADFVLNVEAKNALGWKPVLRFDQSKHQDYHSDLNGEKYETFPGVKTFPDKINTAFSKLKEYCSKGIIISNGQMLEYTTVFDNIKDQILTRNLNIGTTRNSVSMYIGGYIVNPK